MNVKPPNPTIIPGYNNVKDTNKKMGSPIKGLVKRKNTPFLPAVFSLQLYDTKVIHTTKVKSGLNSLFSAVEA